MSRIRSNLITNQAADGAPTVQNGLVISGVTTSTSFSGDGSALTGIDATQIVTGNTSVQTVDTGSDGHVKINTEGSERLRIDSSGRMMIGTTAASTLTSADDLTISTSGSTGITLFAATGNAGNIAFGDGTSGDDRQRGILQYHHSDNSMRLFTNAVRRMTINSNGSVGINTVSSDDPNNPGLHIHGSAGDNCRISFSTPTKSNPGSRIGYYGLSNRFGLDVYYGLEVRDVAASYATRFKIDNNGYMTNNQPYGYVRFNTHNDTGGEQRQTNVNTHTVENGMSHSSGRLTVPAAGKYYIGIHGNVLDNNSAAQYLYINGSKSNGWNWQQNDTVSYWKSSMVGGVIALNANDYLDVYVTGKQDNASWNMWTVYMLG